jgi:hypothetical protein
VRFQVAVQFACVMQRVHAATELHHGADQCASIAVSCIRQEVAAFDERHREESEIPRDVQLVERHEVRMTEISERPELALDPIQLFRSSTVQNLECHALSPLWIERLVHAPVAAASQRAEQPKASDVEQRARLTKQMFASQREPEFDLGLMTLIRWNGPHALSKLCDDRS